MKWIKLIDKKPDSWHLKVARTIHTKVVILDVPTLLSEFPNKKDIIEWLDEESEPLSPTAASAEEILRKHYELDNKDAVYKTEPFDNVESMGGHQWIYNAMNEYRTTAAGMGVGAEDVSKIENLKDEIDDLSSWVAIFYGALKELVELKELKETLFKGNPDGKEYAERKPLAWNTAKQAVDIWKKSDYGALPLKAALQSYLNLPDGREDGKKTVTGEVD